MTSEKAYDVSQRMDAHIAAHLATVPGTSPGLGTSMTTCMSVVLPTTDVYVVQGALLINAQSSGGTLSYRANPAGGLAAAASRIAWAELNGTSVGVVAMNGIGNTITGSTIGGGLADRLVWFTGTVQPATPGTLNIQAALSSGSATAYSVGSHVDAWKIT